MSESNENKVDLKCLRKDFFSLMTKESDIDCSHTIKEQISTENLVRSAYEDFLDNYMSDPEYKLSLISLFLIVF